MRGVTESMRVSFVLLLVFVVAAMARPVAPPKEPSSAPNYMSEHAPALLAVYAREKLATLHPDGSPAADGTVQAMVDRMLARLEKQADTEQLRFLNEVHARLAV